jgi:hypothetical protein
LRAIDAEADAAMRALVELFSGPKRHGGWRTYVLEHVDGEWVFRPHEFDAIFDAILEAPDPDLDSTNESTGDKPR